jgi:hypothetical protein
MALSSSPTTWSEPLTSAPHLPESKRGPGHTGASKSFPHSPARRGFERVRKGERKCAKC